MDVFVSPCVYMVVSVWCYVYGERLAVCTCAKAGMTHGIRECQGEFVCVLR